jgi:2-polyprenyl-6-methoxyphenol hydroxylase-like FAD-dependent oxidoreductase
MAVTRLASAIAAVSGRGAHEPSVNVWDLVISGGGPVGLVTALAARRLGLSALVLEQAHGLPLKACGEGLMPGAVSALEQLGVSLSDSREFRGVCFLDGDSVASASFGERPGRALSRGLLLQRLSERAAELDVPVRAGQTLRDFRYQDGLVRIRASAPGGPVNYRARLLVAADGLRSPIRRKLGYELPARRVSGCSATSVLHRGRIGWRCTGTIRGKRMSRRSLRIWWALRC